MIQQISRTGKKAGAFVFILNTTQQTKINDLDEIEKHISDISSSTFANTEFSNNNHPKFPSKFNSLSQVINIGKSDLNNIMSIASSKAGLVINERVDLFNLVTDIDNQLRKKTKKNQIKKYRQTCKAFL